MINSEFEKVEDEAASWAVRLTDDPDDLELQRQFQLWLGENSANEEAWARVCRVFEGLKQLQPAKADGWPASSFMNEQVAPIANEFHKVSYPSQIALKQNYLRSIESWVGSRKLLSGIAIIICLLFAVIPQIQLRLAADFISSTGERQMHLLPDGTRLFLAPQSAVDITFEGTQRVVQLLRGGAFFEVSPDATRLFHVYAGDTRTTVLGTDFDVRKTGSGTSVSVVRGRVKVVDDSVQPSVTEYLGSGDRLNVIWGQRADLTHVAPDEIAVWRTGVLIARDVTIGEVVDSLRPYHRGVIFVVKPLADKRVTGLYRLDDPMTTLAGIAQAHGGAVQKVGPLVVVSQQINN